MKSDWVPLSASALVIGAMALVFGALLNPADAGASTARTLQVAGEDSARWLAMAVMYLIASWTLTLGLPAVLTLFERRGRRIGLAGCALFAVGAIGTSGYAMLLVFFRAMVVADAVRGKALERVSGDPALSVFLEVWVGGFYLGVLLLAIGLLRSGSVPRWAPVLMILFVVALPFSSSMGRIGTALQVMALAVAFTAVAMAAVTGEQTRRPVGQPAF